MRCSTVRDSGGTCGLRYCSRFIELRYPDIAFEAYARYFVCLRCLDTCNCTVCCSKRGETYISARIGKLPPPNSAEALALIKEVENNLKSDAPSRVVTRRMITPPAPKFDLVPGRFFGVIYGLEGERMGPGYMGEDSSQEGSLIPLPLGKIYVGDRSVLDKGTYVSMDELIVRAMREEEEDLVWGGPLWDPPSMADQDEAVAPARPDVAHSTLDVQYAIAIAYHTLQGSPKDQARIAAADAVRSWSGRGAGHDRTCT
ncbi:hypothetical protein V8D89_009957 [Ganoderma adspersum]